MDRHFLVTIGDDDVFSTEVTLARVDPEVVIGAPMVQHERGDDPIEDAVEVLREVLTEGEEI